MFARAIGDIPRHAGNASEAAETAASTSAADDAANRPIKSSELAGFQLSNVPPDAAGTHSPPM
jgi:hypothetical protein